MLDFTFNNFTTDRVYSEIFFAKILETAAKETDLKSKKTELSVNLVGEGRIKTLNKKYRGRNRVTDVLSFPVQKEVDIVKTGKDAILDLGDIFICLPVAKKNAARESVSLDSKISYLVVHGFLHLLRYDHEGSATEKDKMFALQNKILSKTSF